MCPRQILVKSSLTLRQCGSFCSRCVIYAYFLYILKNMFASVQMKPWAPEKVLKLSARCSLVIVNIDSVWPHLMLSAGGPGHEAACSWEDTLVVPDSSEAPTLVLHHLHYRHLLGRPTLQPDQEVNIPSTCYMCC